MSFWKAPNLVLRTALFVLVCGLAPTATAFAATTMSEGRGGLGVIRGTVRDDLGNPIANAYVSFFKVGSTNLLKQVRSTSTGAFVAKIVPGTYTVLAIAEGYNPVSYREVEINRSSQLNYKFNLERSGLGRTLPEKRVDRNSSKWRIRAAQIGASIYQNQESEKPIVPSDETVATEEFDDVSDDEVERAGERPRQTVVETFTAATEDAILGGVNFATLMPVGERTEIVIAGQTSFGPRAPQRLEASIGSRLSAEHLLRLNASIAKMGSVEVDGRPRELGQVTVQATDEWRLRPNVVVLFGFDYARFFGAGNRQSLTPRLGLQYDLNRQTRFRTSLTTQTEERSWQQAIEMEGTTIAFRDPTVVNRYVVRDDKPLMNRSRRLEFGIERILDARSSVEANVFFDLVNGRGVGLINVPLGFLSDDGGRFVGEQEGAARGVRVVYSRRINSIFSASTGYSAGEGQRLSSRGITTPKELFERDGFQSFFTQLDADLRSGTQVRTVFRLSPQATVFAIDPFKGRMTIFDPGLSVFVTQSLPNLGLPFRAEAIFDARNLLDQTTGISGEEGSLILNLQRRMLRGGIMVRF